MTNHIRHRFNQKEKSQIKKYYEIYGEDCFYKLEEDFGLSVRATKEHFRDYIEADQNPFSASEDEQLTTLKAQGLSFAEMIIHFKNRTWVQLRNRYMCLQKSQNKGHNFFTPMFFHSPISPLSSLSTPSTTRFCFLFYRILFFPINYLIVCILNSFPKNLFKIFPTNFIFS
jgi:hypothetical protein